MIKNTKGFTLVELMVVILIIAILIAVAVPVFMGARTRARDNVARQALTNAARAAAGYYASEGALPTTVQLDAEEGAYSYTDAADNTGAPAFSTPPNLEYNATTGELRITSQSGSVFQIIVSAANGSVGAIAADT